MFPGWILEYYDPETPRPSSFSTSFSECKIYAPPASQFCLAVIYFFECVPLEGAQGFVFPATSFHLHSEGFPPGGRDQHQSHVTGKEGVGGIHVWLSVFRKGLGGKTQTGKASYRCTFMHNSIRKKKS